MLALIGDVPPAECDAPCSTQAAVACFSAFRLRETRDDSRRYRFVTLKLPAIAIVQLNAENVPVIEFPLIIDVAE